MLLVGLKEQYESKIKDKNMNRESMIHKRDVVKKYGNLQWHLPLSIRAPPPLMVKGSIHSIQSFIYTLDIIF